MRYHAETSPTADVVVIGAGTMGAWTALHTVRSGRRTVLVDAYGAGHPRATSGGETRIIRATYGPKPQYVRMAVRALQLWKENEKRWGQKLFHRTGVLWMTSPEDEFEKASLPLLREAGVEFEELSAAEAGKRFPQINFEQVKWAIYERDRLDPSHPAATSSGGLAGNERCSRPERRRVGWETS